MRAKIVQRMVAPLISHVRHVGISITSHVRRICHSHAPLISHVRLFVVSATSLIRYVCGSLRPTMRWITSHVRRMLAWVVKLLLVGVAGVVVLILGGILAVTLISMLSGCCHKPHLQSSATDSVRIEVSTRTEYIRDTVYLEIPSQRETTIVPDSSSHLENDYAISEARITHQGLLFHSLATKPQRKPLPYDRPVVRRDSIVWRDHKSTQSVERDRDLTWWQRTQIRGFWLLLAVMALLLRRQIASVVRWFV